MKFTQLLKSIDMFGRSFNINIRGRIKSGTTFGGVITIFSLFGLFVYSVLLSLKIFSHEAVIKTQERIYHDLEDL